VISKGSLVKYYGTKSMVEKTYGKDEFVVWSGKRRGDADDSGVDK